MDHLRAMMQEVPYSHHQPHLEQEVYGPALDLAPTNNMVSPNTRDMLDQISSNDSSEQDKLRMEMLMLDAPDRPYECMDTDDQVQQQISVQSTNQQFYYNGADQQHNHLMSFSYNNGSLNLAKQTRQRQPTFQPMISHREQRAAFPENNNQFLQLTNRPILGSFRGPVLAQQSAKSNSRLSGSHANNVLFSSGSGTHRLGANQLSSYNLTQRQTLQSYKSKPSKGSSKMSVSKLQSEESILSRIEMLNREKDLLLKQL